MKTLKQTLTENHGEELANYIINEIKKWLTQKRQEYQERAEDWAKFDPDPMSHSKTKAWAKPETIDELLEELNQ